LNTRQLGVQGVNEKALNDSIKREKTLRRLAVEMGSEKLTRRIGRPSRPLIWTDGEGGSHMNRGKRHHFLKRGKGFDDEK